MTTYDKKSRQSILEYSKRLLGKSLEQAVGCTVIVPYEGKGQLGQLVEKYFFGYDCNGNSEADFKDAGLELKCTPLKLLKDNSYAIKERLVLTMINFSEVYKKDFRNSHVLEKCLAMLIPFYLHEYGVPAYKLKFIYSILWQIPEKDLLIMEQDYNLIISKIKLGKAHEISEGDTTYLGACTKGQKGDSPDVYILPNGETASEPAPKRAFSLKTAYMRTILEFAKQTGGQGVANYNIERNSFELLKAEDLRKKTFEEVLLDRLTPYIGKSYDEICLETGVLPSNAKHKYAMLSKQLLTIGLSSTAVEESDEFKKSGITLKTFRVDANGIPCEAMSFENINYCEIVTEEVWEDSKLYEIFCGRFLFVVFKEHIEDGVSVYKLADAFFWTMPRKNLASAEEYWLNIKYNVANERIEPMYFYKEKDGKNFHVRPKATKATDMAVTPSGKLAKKYCYWFNKSYVKQILDERQV